MKNKMSDIRFDLVRVEAPAASRGQAFRSLSKDIAAMVPLRRLITAGYLHDKLLSQECAKSAMLDDGIALYSLPVSGLEKPLIVLTHLMSAIDLKAADGRGTDVLCVLLVSAGQVVPGLQKFAQLSRFLKSPAIAERIRASENSDMLEAMLAAPEGWLIAA